ncbi:MepB family protein [Vibrio cyclitrophicus]
MLDRYPQNSKYEALEFSIDGKKILYRKGNVTPDRPGNFLSIWKRPDENSTDPRRTMPYEEHDLDYLFVKVSDCDISKRGIYIFPLTVLVNKGVVTSNKAKGKMAFRVFPPWTSSRGELKSKVFSDSAKKTQRWQSNFFLWIEDNEIVDLDKFNNIFINLN